MLEKLKSTCHEIFNSKFPKACAKNTNQILHALLRLADLTKKSIKSN